MVKKVLIMMGLPASGKTTFSEEYEKMYTKTGYGLTNKQKYYVKHIDVDKELMMANGVYKPKVNLQGVIARNHYKTNDELIIDGLFLNTDDIINIIKMLHLKDVVYEIHYWIPDRDKCLHNDIGRRKEDSTITIKNAELELPDLNKIKETCSVEEIVIVKHKIIEKPFWKVKADELEIDIRDKKYIYSGEWSLGGTWGSYTGAKGVVNPDPTPDSFEELDNLLEKICPNITFLQYKNIYSACVDTEERSNSDYYGGSTTDCYYKCDLEKLFELLKVKGIIQ